MIVFKAKLGGGGGGQEKEVAWVQTTSPCPLPAMSSVLWGHADHHGELGTPSMLSAPPAAGIPSIPKHRQAPESSCSQGSPCWAVGDFWHWERSQRSPSRVGKRARDLGTLLLEAAELSSGLGEAGPARLPWPGFFLHIQLDSAGKRRGKIF